MGVVDARTASVDLLVALLGLRPDEVADVVAAKPFTDLFAFRRALPVRIAIGLHSFDIPKPDINSLSAADLSSRFGLDSAIATAIAGKRPYFSLGEIRHVQGTSADLFARISAACEVPDLTYTDKASGRPIQLHVDSSKVMVKFNETEGDEVPQLIAKLNLSRSFPKTSKGASIQVFNLPETEGDDDVLGQIKREPGVDQAIPGFRDGKQQRLLDPEFCVVQFAEHTDDATIASVIKQAGLEVAQSHRSPGLKTLRIPDARTRPGALATAIAFLNAQPQVKFAEPNYLGFDDLELSDVLVASDPDDAAGWHLRLINLAAAQADGAGSPDIVVAVVDSGVDLTHPALSDALLSRKTGEDWDFVSSSGDPVDDQGHGTFIAGILVGNGAAGVRGVCPGCRLLPLRVPLSGESDSYPSRADAILYALQYAAARRVVINLSWKTTGDVAVVREAIRTVIASGAVIVASAGNEPDGPDEVHFPSDYDGVISVAAVGPDSRRASYSFFGNRINLAAPGGAGVGDGNPGQDLLSAALAGGVTVAAGTSFAAPHVAGVAALVLSHAGSSSPTAVASILEKSAAVLSETGLGSGLLNAAAAVRMATSGQGGSSPAGGPVKGPTEPVGLGLINAGDRAALVAQFGLLDFTAQLLIARRPLTDITTIHGALGLTELQFAALSAQAA